MALWWQQQGSQGQWPGSQQGLLLQGSHLLLLLDSRLLLLLLLGILVLLRGSLLGQPCREVLQGMHRVLLPAVQAPVLAGQLAGLLQALLTGGLLLLLLAGPSWPCLVGRRLAAVGLAAAAELPQA